jgi:hypothetical protein
VRGRGAFCKAYPQTPSLEARVTPLNLREHLKRLVFSSGGDDSHRPCQSFSLKAQRFGQPVSPRNPAVQTRWANAIPPCSRWVDSSGNDSGDNALGGKSQMVWNFCQGQHCSDLAPRFIWIFRCSAVQPIEPPLADRARRVAARHEIAGLARPTGAARISSGGQHSCAADLSIVSC